MKEYKVIINTETGIICSVETFVRNVNEEQKSAYTVGKIYGESEGVIYESEESLKKEQIDQPLINHLINHLFNRISALEGSRDSIRELLEKCLIDPNRIIALEKAQDNQTQINNNQSQINNTLNVAYDDLKNYALLQIDNIIKEIYLQRGMRGDKNENPEGNVKRGRGRPRKSYLLNPDEKDKKRVGRPRTVISTVKNKKQGRGHQKKGTK